MWEKAIPTYRVHHFPPPYLLIVCSFFLHVVFYFAGLFSFVSFSPNAVFTYVFSYVDPVSGAYPLNTLSLATTSIQVHALEMYYAMTLVICHGVLLTGNLSLAVVVAIVVVVKLWFKLSWERRW